MFIFWQLSNFYLISVVLSILGLGIGSLVYILYMSNLGSQEIGKIRPYECGFKPFSNYFCHPFDIAYYKIRLSFIIFDLELVLFRPLIKNSLIVWTRESYLRVLFIREVLFFSWLMEWYNGIFKF
jgi:NADH:ubiquinone oxidoreductase subunit 3 (subunit A)